MADPLKEVCRGCDRALKTIERCLEGQRPDKVALSQAAEAMASLWEMGLVESPGKTTAKSTKVEQRLARHTALYAKYMLALGHLILGDVTSCDEHLSSLGFKWRLSSNVMAAAAAGPPSMGSSPLDTDLATVWDDVLSSETLASLGRFEDPSSAYWQHIDYDSPNARFHSYFCALSSPPKNAVEHAIHQLYHGLCDRRPEMASIDRAEWWCHKRPVCNSWSSGCHQLHFDCDEGTFGGDPSAANAEIVPLKHPVLSSVLFLGPCACGGPTLVTDKRPGSARIGTRGVLTWPHHGRYLVFPGDALHGVLPSVAPCTCASSKHCLRVSLIVAWWHRDSEVKPRCNPEGIGAFQHCPCDGDDGWVTEFAVPVESGKGQQDTEWNAGSFGTQEIAPLWEMCTDSRVEPGDTSSTGQLIPTYTQGADDPDPFPPFRFFLTDQSMIDRIYKEAAVQVFWESKLNEQTQ